MTTHKPANVLSAPFPHAVLIPEGQHAHLPPIAIGRVLTLIGSEDTVHIRLRSRTISPVHAILLNADGRVILRDLASHTHVYVNSRLVREAVLNEGDKIRVGRIRFIFRAGGLVPGEPTPEMQPMKLWNQDGKPVSIKSSIFVIGRRRDTDLVCHNTPEPAHAVIFSIGGHRFLRHLKLSAPVSLNDREIRQSLLNDGDVIEVCGERFQFASTGQAFAAPSGEVEIAPAETSLQPEFDAGLSPVLAALQKRTDAPEPIGIFHPGDVEAPAAAIPPAAESLISEPEPIAETVQPIESPTEFSSETEQPVAEVEAPESNQPVTQACDELTTPIQDEKSWEPPAEVAEPVVEQQPESELPPVEEELLHDSGAPAIAATADVVQESSPTAGGPERRTMGLVVSDDMLPSLKEWGPLAMAMLSQQRQDVFPEPAPVAAEETPTKKWAWMSMVAAIALAVGAGIWFTFRGSL